MHRMRESLSYSALGKASLYAAPNVPLSARDDRLNITGTDLEVERGRYVPPRFRALRFSACAASSVCDAVR